MHSYRLQLGRRSGEGRMDIVAYTNKALDNRRLMLAVTLALFCQVWIAECQDNDGVSCNTTRIQKASIGRKLNITCTVFCPAGTYRWSNSTGQLPGETGAVLTVSEKVESAAAVGGRRYVCQCGERRDTQCHLIQVIPFVKFDVSRKVAKLGSSVTLTCSAESYPPADNVDFFQLHHPLDHSIPHDQLTLNGTSVEYHVANASQSDGGEYDCVVSVPAPDGEHLQNKTSTYLTVYDPPVISETRSSAISLSSVHEGESAVLECTVKNPEANVKVWVNWTTGSGFDLLTRDDYTVGRSEDGVHFLVLHRVTEDKVHPYTCQLYSNYSPTIPEDQKIVNITEIDHQETSELSKREDCDFSTATIAAFVILTTAIIIISIILVVVVFRKYICRRKSELRRTEGGTVQNNPAYHNIELPVRDDKSPTSVSPELGEEGPEQGMTVTIINQNDLSTQSKSSITSTEEKGDPVSNSAVHNTTDPQAMKNRSASMKEESHPSLSVSPTKGRSLSDQIPLSPKTIVSTLGFVAGFVSGYATKPLIKEDAGEESDADSDEHTQ